MSIHVTVNSNPLCINRSKVLLSDLELAKKNEWNRRRKLRLQQVLLFLRTVYTIFFLHFLLLTLLCCVKLFFKPRKAEHERLRDLFLLCHHQAIGEPTTPIQ